MLSNSNSPSDIIFFWDTFFVYFTKLNCTENTIYCFFNLCDFLDPFDKMVYSYENVFFWPEFPTILALSINFPKFIWMRLKHWGVFVFTLREPERVQMWHFIIKSGILFTRFSHLYLWCMWKFIHYFEPKQRIIWYFLRIFDFSLVVSSSFPMLFTCLEIPSAKFLYLGIY